MAGLTDKVKAEYKAVMKIAIFAVSARRSCDQFRRITVDYERSER